MKYYEFKGYILSMKYYKFKEYIIIMKYYKFKVYTGIISMKYYKFKGNFYPTYTVISCIHSFLLKYKIITCRWMLISWRNRDD